MDRVIILKFLIHELETTQTENIDEAIDKLIKYKKFNKF